MYLAQKDDALRKLLVESSNYRKKIGGIQIKMENYIKENKKTSTNSNLNSKMKIGNQNDFVYLLKNYKVH